MVNKFITRKTMKDKRVCMPKEAVKELSGAICKTLLSMDIYQNANCICLYISAKNEVDTTPIIEAALQAGKMVAAPRVRDKQMDFIVFHSMEELELGSFGILEPTGAEVVTPEQALLIMPGVAFDMNCNRIGYGGGFYDRYLAEHEAKVSVAFAYELQMVEQLEVEGFDKKPDMIITEKRVITGK